MSFLPALISTMIAVTASTPLVLSQTHGDSARVIAYPNPSCLATIFEVFVPKDSATIEIEAYDILGRRVATLVRIEEIRFSRGRHSVPYSGRNVNGEYLPFGYYIVVVLSRGEVVGTATFVCACPS